MSNLGRLRRNAENYMEKMNLEEAIELLKEMKENCIDKGKTYYEDDKRVKKALAIEKVLEELENAKKERDGIYADYQELGIEFYNSVSKDKIKSKIEENMKKLREATKEQDIDNMYFYEIRILTLQELLESEKAYE